MKDRKEKSGAPILAAGGIVLRDDLDPAPRFAVVLSHKMKTWGLPKGKLAAGEDALAAARREVLEETGYRVTVHEFLGTLVYERSGQPKVVQFWRMEAAGEPAGDLMGDVIAVRWLPLQDAIERLARLRERVFLEQVGPIALKLAARPSRPALFPGNTATGILVPGVPLAPAVAGPPSFGRHFTVPPASAANGLIRDGLHEGRRRVDRERADQDSAVQSCDGEYVGRRGETRPVEKSHGGNALMKKTWGWFRHAGLLHRPPFD